MSGIIVSTSKRVVKTITVTGEDNVTACDALNEEIAKLIEIDKEARPLFPVMELECPTAYVLVQQWTYTYNTEYTT